MERYAENDFNLVEGLARRAAALAEDPLQEVMLFLKLFEQWLEELDDPLPGCIYASYTYESQLFEESIRSFVAEQINKWMALYEERFERILTEFRPKVPGVSARDLSELIAAVVQGGIVLSLALSDRLFLVRQSRQIRNYLKLLFDE